MLFTRPLHKITVLGSGGVGKTSLIVQFCHNSCPDVYDPTIEDSYRKEIALDGEPTTLEIVDTAGQEVYDSLFDQWVRQGEGLAVVFSLIDANSFENVRNYIDKITHILEAEKNPMVQFKKPIIIIGNKSDCTFKRVVSEQAASAYAKSVNCNLFFTSAKDNYNVSNAFVSLAVEIKNRKDKLMGRAAMPGAAVPKPRRSSRCVIL